MNFDSNAEERLHHAVERLYRVFGHYRGKPDWGDDLDMKTTEESTLLCRLPVCKLPAATFTYYSWHALTLFGVNVAALKYFLPRIIDNALHDMRAEPDWKEWCDVGPEMLICELNRAQCRNWSHEEVTAIQEIFAAWFTACIQDATTRPEGERGMSRYVLRPKRYAGEVLGFIALLGFDVTPQLEEWQNTPVTFATLQLVTFINENTDEMAQRTRLDDWTEMWGEVSVSDKTMQQAMVWLLSPAIRSRLEREFLAATDPALQIALGEGITNQELVVSAWANRQGTKDFPEWAVKVVGTYFHTDKAGD